MAHLLISAAHKSSGKTTVSVGLAAAFGARGLRVQPFKKGPDYIDPMWLARASGRPCYNLDFNTQSEAEMRALFARHAGRADLALIQGNKGLHDGIDIEGRDSSAALAKLVDAPVILVIDATGITRGVAPLVLGCQVFDRDVAIRGVILNRVASARQEGKLRQTLERYIDVPVIGAIGRDPTLVVQERHLGLTTPDETAALDKMISRLRLAVERGVESRPRPGVRLPRAGNRAPARECGPGSPSPRQGEGCRRHVRRAHRGGPRHGVRLLLSGRSRGAGAGGRRSRFFQYASRYTPAGSRRSFHRRRLPRDADADARGE